MRKQGAGSLGVKDEAIAHRQICASAGSEGQSDSLSRVVNHSKSLLKLLEMQRAFSTNAEGSHGRLVLDLVNRKPIRMKRL
jgi:hypothetical protein